MVDDRDPNMASPERNQHGEKPNMLANSHGWDGKLRIEKRAILTNPEVLSDSEHSDEDAPPVEQIAADEGTQATA